MALDDTKVVNVSGGQFYLNTTSTAATPITTVPTDLKNPGTGWEDFGHTSLDDILGFDQEGGDASTLGTLQSPNLITRFAAITDSITFTLEQWDENAYKAYFGANVVDVNGDGTFWGINKTPTQVQGALLIVLWSGDFVLPVMAPLATVYRGDAISVGGTDELAGLPITVTPQSATGVSWMWGLGEVTKYVAP